MIASSIHLSYPDMNHRIMARTSTLFFDPVINASSPFPTLKKLIKVKFFSTGGSTGRIQRCLVKVRAENSDPQSSQQQVNLSVLRFTLGIPGFDESNLPRWIGFGFGSLVVLNHFLSSDPTPAQTRSEVLGVFLAIFSYTLPYLGKFLEGVSSVNRLPMPEGSKQIFILSENISDKLKQDLAWASYALLRNTNTICVLIAINDSICIRGYWDNDTSEDISRDDLMKKLNDQIEQEGLLGLRETLYFPNFTESQFGKIVPKELVSAVIAPIAGEFNSRGRNCGFVLVGSNSNYAYSDKDLAWIKSVASKFRVSKPKDIESI